MDLVQVPERVYPVGRLDADVSSTENSIVVSNAPRPGAPSRRSTASVGDANQVGKVLMDPSCREGIQHQHPQGGYGST